MTDLLLVATMLLVCGGIGLPIAQLLPERFAWRLLLAPTLGTAVLSFAVPIAYRAGVTILYFFWISAAIAVVLLVWRGRSVVRALRELPPEQKRLGWIVVGVNAVTMLLLLAPRWAGGDQFSVFQGNTWDLFGYLESATVYARKRYSAVAHVTDYTTMRNPMFALASGQLSNRPSVHQLYAVFTRIAPGEAYRLYYPFLAFSFLQGAQVATFVLRNSFPKLARFAWLAVPLAFPLGFWGQSVLDLNAWSQAAAQPLLFLIFGLTLNVLAEAETEVRAAARIAAVLGVVVAGAIYLYPEGMVIYAAALGPIGVVVVIARIVRARAVRVAPLVPLLGYVAVATVVFYPPQLAFLIAQVKWSSGHAVPWWQFFQIFFYGRDGLPSHGFARFADFNAALFGLYFATPRKGAGLVFGMIRRVAILITILGLLAGVLGVIAGKIAHGDRARRHVALWSATAVLMLVPAARLALQANYWAAGKVVGFASPVFITLLCIPVGFAMTGMWRWVRALIALFLVFQIAMGVTRIGAAHRRHGIHYAPPYPAIQNPDLKRDLPWDLRPLEAQLTPSTKVLLHPMNPWMQSYLMVFLFSRRIPFALDGKVNTYFGDGVDLPGLPPPWQPDAEITLERKAIDVMFRDGRPPLRVVSDDNLR